MRTVENSIEKATKSATYFHIIIQRYVQIFTQNHSISLNIAENQKMLKINQIGEQNSY